MKAPVSQARPPAQKNAISACTDIHLCGVQHEQHCVLYVQAYLGKDVDVQLHEGTHVTGYAPNSEDAINACTDTDVCIFFVGSSMMSVHEQEDPKGQYMMWSGTTEGEGFDRTHLRLPGSQEEIIKVRNFLRVSGSNPTLCITRSGAIQQRERALIGLPRACQADKRRSSRRREC